MREFTTEDGTRVMLLSIDPEMDLRESVLRNIEVEVDSQGWDQKPFIAVISSPPGGPIEVSSMPMPEDFYEAPEHVTPVIIEIAREDPELSAKLTQLLPEWYEGLVFISEVWGFRALAEDEPIPDTWEDAMRNGTIHEHPDRVTRRIALMITSDVALLLLRDQEHGMLGCKRMETAAISAVRGFPNSIVIMRDLDALFREVCPAPFTKIPPAKEDNG